MLDLSLFRNRTFAGANTVMLLTALAMFGVFFYVSLFMQQVLGYSPTQAGAAFLPMTVLIILVAPQAGRLADRIGPRPFVGGGLLLVASRSLLFSRVTADSTFWALLPGDAPRRHRDGGDDDADDGGRDGLGAARQGGRRLGRAEQHAPGRRLARDRDHGRDRRRGRVERARGRRASGRSFVDGLHHGLAGRRR